MVSSEKIAPPKKMSVSDDKYESLAFEMSKMKDFIKKEKKVKSTLDLKDVMD